MTKKTKPTTTSSTSPQLELFPDAPPAATPAPTPTTPPPTPATPPPTPAAPPSENSPAPPASSAPAKIPPSYVPPPDHPYAHLLDIGEFWTAGQRQANSLHEVSYRACFKPQLPEYFITRHTKPGDLVYDPFGGRGTTAIEAALHGRRVATNDINPLSRILTEPRLELPPPALIRARLDALAPLLAQTDAHPLTPDIDLTMFYEPRTLQHLLALRAYLHERRVTATEDSADRWLRMVATNRLTGHSPGFFSVYTLPPNQAASAKRQIEINRKRAQTPPYRDILAIIWKKTRNLTSDLTPAQTASLRAAARDAQYLNAPAASTPALASNTVALTVTSPPFLNIVQYADDNWLRCWFNRIDTAAVAKRITMSTKLAVWDAAMRDVLRELHRVTRPGGHVAFEVGEVRKGAIRLEETVVPAAEAAGFICQKILINAQTFTKTANIWGIDNNASGTNTNRIVLVQKP
ncbi:MAG: hypothetical protein LBM04_01925 [Opitutaceae bacterium]|jgi:hypothetical protein|nr:hypothetical protein [Opitutaceae bacterium]